MALSHCGERCAMLCAQVFPSHSAAQGQEQLPVRLRRGHPAAAAAAGAGQAGEDRPGVHHPRPG